MDTQTPWAKVIGAAVGLSCLIGVLVIAFVWPNSELKPRDAPIVVAAPEQAIAQLEAQLDESAPDAFDLEAVADVEAARQAIENRDAYGAIVLDSSGPPAVLTASAGSPAMAEALEGLATQLAGDSPSSATNLEDVVALPEDDPRGLGFNVGAMPMVIGGIAIGAAMCLAVAGVSRRMAGVSLAAALGGVVAASVMQGWFGVLDGAGWHNAGAFTMMFGAVGLAIVGLHAVAGKVGLGLGALTMMALGNPLSGVTSAPEMLPAGWGALGQALPPGAGGSLLRSTAYFEGAGASGPLLVLGSWIVGGLLLGAIGLMRQSSTRPRVRSREQVADVVG